MLRLMREAVVGKVEPLSNPDAARDYFSSLPRDDMLATQGTLSTALAEVACRLDPDVNRLRALIALDLGARSLLLRLRGDYCLAAFQSSPRAPQLRRALVELSGSFAHAYYAFLRHLREKGADGDWVRLLPRLSVQFFQHCETELFVSSLNYERWPHNRLRQLNATFQFVLAHGLARRRVAREKRGDEIIRTVTPEQAFLRILVLRLTGTSAMTPKEMTLASQWIDNWSSRATLLRMGSSAPLMDEGFAVDLSGSEGLVRAPIDSDVTRPVFHFDPLPIVAAIDRELAKIIGAGDDSGPVSSESKIALLARLKRSLSPRAGPIQRRDDRISAPLMTVEALAGQLTDVFRVLRDDARRMAQETTGFAYSDAVTLGENLAVTPVNVDSVPSLMWRVRDYSESGLRLCGRSGETQDLIPGSLILTRGNAQWTLYVVRWMMRRVGTSFEVGIERLGGRPQCVVVCPMNDDGEPILQKSERRPALFLQDDKPTATAHRSLVLPAEDYAPGRILTLLSRTSETTIRLCQPLEHQREFVWTSVEILRTRTRLH